MRKPISTRAAIAVVVTAAVLAVTGGMAGARSAPSGGSSAAATRAVKVIDDRFAPKRLKVVKRTRIEWVWSSRNKASHTLYLDERPEGVKPFQTRPETAPFRFTRKLRKPGAYTILCTLHEGMRMRIDVTRLPAGRFTP